MAIAVIIIIRLLVAAVRYYGERYANQRVLDVRNALLENASFESRYRHCSRTRGRAIEDDALDSRRFIFITILD